MKRNWTLIRVLLEQIEKETLVEFLSERPYESQYTEKEVYGHLEILFHSDILAGGEVTRDAIGRFWAPAIDGVYITMSGHDLLDCLRDKPVWERIKGSGLY